MTALIVLDAVASASHVSMTNHVTKGAADAKAPQRFARQDRSFGIPRRNKHNALVIPTGVTGVR